tara:strand:+ start:253 stop:525 length:273 start_codon:yes stop_codon:yes gene_type:complete
MPYFFHNLKIKLLTSKYNVLNQNQIMGIHYDYKSTRSSKAMEKQAKKERKLAERKAKREAKEGVKILESEIKPDVQKPITLEDLTNPDKK